LQDPLLLVFGIGNALFIGTGFDNASELAATACEFDRSRKTDQRAGSVEHGFRSSAARCGCSANGKPESSKPSFGHPSGNQSSLADTGGFCRVHDSTGGHS
jgi:hypothetical protein